MEDLIVAARKRFSTRGPRKIHARLVERSPDKYVPGASVIAKVLERRDMTEASEAELAPAVGVTAPFPAAADLEREPSSVEPWPHGSVVAPRSPRAILETTTRDDVTAPVAAADAQA